MSWGANNGARRRNHSLRGPVFSRADVAPVDFCAPRPASLPSEAPQLPRDDIPELPARGDRPQFEQGTQRSQK